MPSRGYIPQTRGSADLAKRSDAVLTWLDRIGYSPKPSSRIDVYIRVIQDAAAHESGIDPDLLIRAIRELSELYVIRCKFRFCPIPRNARPLFSNLVRGGIFPDEEGQNTAARDSQFHLYLAAVLRLAWVFPAFDEPDLVLPRRSLGIAVKRLTGTSPTNFNRRLRKGSDQLAQAGMRGIICIDATEVMAPRREMMHFDSNAALDQFYSEVDQWFETFLSHHGSEVEASVDPSYVISVLIFWNVVCFLTESGTATEHTFVGSVPMHDEGSDVRRSALFLKRVFGRGLRRADQL